MLFIQIKKMKEAAEVARRGFVRTVRALELPCRVYYLAHEDFSMPKEVLPILCMKVEMQMAI